jgi:uncharacterized protein YceH (UPF0502 family)
MSDTHPAADSVQPPPRIEPLSPEELRVLGCLVEKQCTTPEYYPLTVNALVAACNQKNNRDPVVAYDETTVVRALDRLRDRRLAALVSTAGGRAPKFKHLFPETYGLDARDTALLCELILRGPQTAGELRGRCERYTPMEGVPETQAALDALAARPTPLVARLPRQPGQKEPRYAHLLGEPAPSQAEINRNDFGSPDALNGLSARLEKLEAEVTALRAEIAALRDALAPILRP